MDGGNLVQSVSFEMWKLLSKIDADLNVSLLVVLRGLKKKCEDESFAIRSKTYIYKTDLNLVGVSC